MASVAELEVEEGVVFGGVLGVPLDFLEVDDDVGEVFDRVSHHDLGFMGVFG